MLIASELPVNYSFYVCENLGADAENISHFSAEEIARLSQLESQDFASLNVLVLIRDRQDTNLDLANLPLIGLPDSSFLSFKDRPSLITKKEIRLAILGELALNKNKQSGILVRERVRYRLRLLACVPMREYMRSKRQGWVRL